MVGRYCLAVIAIALVLSVINPAALAAGKDICDDRGKLKGWARKQGYTQADCAPPQEPANTAPTVTITSPATGSSVDESTPLTFVVSAIDTEDGELSSKAQ